MQAIIRSRSSSGPGDDLVRSYGAHEERSRADARDLFTRPTVKHLYSRTKRAQRCPGLWQTIRGTAGS